MKALKVATQLGSAAVASKNPKLLLCKQVCKQVNSTVLGKGVPKGGAIKIADMNNSAAGLYIYRPK